MRYIHFIYFIRRPAGLLLLAATALLLLAAAPAAGLSLALAAWAHASEQLPGSETNLRYAAFVLAAGATLRLIGQVLRVRALRATPPMLEAYALRTLAGLHQYRGGGSPRWCAAVCVSSLTLERGWQRVAAAAMGQIFGCHV